MLIYPPRTTLRDILQNIIRAGDLVQPDDWPPDDPQAYLEALIQVGGDDLLDEAVYVETQLYMETSERAWIMLVHATPPAILDQGNGWRKVQQVNASRSAATE